MFAFLEKLNNVRVLPKFACRIALLAQMGLCIFITAQHPDLLDGKKHLVVEPLYLVDVCVAPIVELFNDAVLDTFHIHNTIR